MHDSGNLSAHACNAKSNETQRVCIYKQVPSKETALQSTQKHAELNASPVATVIIRLVLYMIGWWSKYNDKMLNTRIMN